MLFSPDRQELTAPPPLPEHVTRPVPVYSHVEEVSLVVEVRIRQRPELLHQRAAQRHTGQAQGRVSAEPLTEEPEPDHTSTPLQPLHCARPQHSVLSAPACVRVPGTH